MKTFHITKGFNIKNLGVWVSALLEVFKGETFYLLAISEEKAKTQAQNRTFHKLLTMYWDSGLSSYSSYEQMRNKFLIVAKLIREFMYADENCKVHNVKTKEEIPAHVLLKDCRVVVDSWANVTKKNAAKAIQALIDEMLKTGVASLEFDKMITEFNTREF